jgi:excisionase family DNA binding protein
MTMKITVEKVSADEVRVTLVADIRITGNVIRTLPGGNAQDTADIARDRAAGGNHARELLTVEQAAEVLQVSRDKVYHLLRTRRLRSAKIGNLRRISPAWIAEFIEQAESGP